MIFVTSSGGSTGNEPVCRRTLLIGMTLPELVELAHRWEAIKISLGYEYGEEFTLTLLAIRDKLYRMKRISHGERVMRQPRVTIHETLFAIYDSSGNIDEQFEEIA